MDRTIKSHRKFEKIAPWMFLLPALIAFTLTKYYPIVMAVFATFFNFTPANPPGDFVGLANYIRLLQDANFYQDLWNMIGYFIVIFAINFWPPIVIAMLVNELRAHKTVFRTLYFIPAIAPTITITLIWVYIWNPDYGLANQLLGMLHLPHNFMWLNDPHLVKWCLYFPYFLMAGGMNFVIYLAALQDVPEELYEASLIDGAGIFSRVWNITLPMIKPIIQVMVVLTVIQVVNLIDQPLIATDGGPFGNSETLGLYAYKKAVRDLDYSYSLTINTVTSMLAFIFAFIQIKILNRKE